MFGAAGAAAAPTFGAGAATAPTFGAAGAAEQEPAAKQPRVEAAASSSSSSSMPVAERSDRSEIQERLRSLRQWHADGLVTDAVLEEKQREILRDL
ncbi:hypothetical protein EMIHUDRAFT_350534 [Emiliania huxleyi CCMP1516]|uniref:SHOCT domain-containing protein n=2 Tax=Emiliania huxleyi TaxID=2903 RepID=A0A0D3IDP2_EMIH1|nr:hypothetical protein EMIHUDRAFT_350534 [Emiliania huxleyi CCMP1516]EOD09377.1 hypothetical protein EMIHUDRAFT_350534 [Emiliania huxleyi CCMP1516]|eukprot:XP_005761806.1 hypothetical protein EMIHUDRAFT_350534 [Emiliania huxleyi CCMP1516]